MSVAAMRAEGPEAEGLPPMADGPVSKALDTLLADERKAAGPKPTAMGTRLRGSMAGKCPRAIGFEIIGYPADLELETSTLVAFSTGTGLHDLVQRALVRHLGAAIEVRATWQPLLDMSVSADAVYPGTAVEIKSMQPFAFDLSTGARKRGEPCGPKPEHLLQAGFAAMAPAIGADRVCMVYIDKATGRLAEWLIDLEEPLPHLDGSTVRLMVEAEVVRMRGILRRLDAGTLPRPIVPGHGLVEDPPARGSRDQPWNCRYCQWQPTCQQLGPEIVPLSMLQRKEI